MTGALLGLLVVVDAAWVSHYALHMHGLAIFDEKFAVEGARWLHDDGSRLFGSTAFTNRGVERLLGAMLVPPIWFAKTTATQFVVDHILVSLLFALQAVAAFLLARDLGARRPWAFVAGALAVVGPWAVFGTVFLNNAPASCFAAFALWAGTRAIVRHSAAWTALVLLFVSLATLMRVSTLVLLGAFAGAIVAHVVMTTRRPRDLVPHWPLGIALALLALWIGTGHIHALVGGYPTHVQATAGLVGNRLLTTSAHLAAGSAFVVFVVGGGWLLRQALRPLAPEANAFAWLALGWFVTLGYVNLASGTDERYELMLFVPLATAFVVAVSRSQVALVPTVFVALVAWIGLHRHGDIGFSQASDYLTWPSREFMSRVLLTKAQYPGGPLRGHGIGRSTMLHLIGIGMVLVGALLALLRERARHWLGIAVAAFAVLYGAAGSGWAMRKLSDTEQPQRTYAQMSFIDRVTGGERTDALASTSETDPGVPHTWNVVQFYNRSVRHPISIGNQVYELCCAGAGVDQVATVDPASGAVASAAPLPRYVATVPEWLPAAFASKLVFVSSAYDRPVRVEKLRQPLLAAWTSSGIDPYGWLRPKQKARLRVYPAGAPAAPACLRLSIQAPALPGGTTKWRIAPLERGRAAVAGGALTTRQTIRTDVRLHGAQPVDLAVTASRVAPDPLTGQPGLLGISDLRLQRCGEPDMPARLDP